LIKIMNRSTLKQLLFNQAKRLTVRHHDYADFLEQLALLQLKTDLGRYGDITSEAVFNEDNPEITAKIISHEAGLLAGLEEISYLLAVPSIKGLLLSHFPITCYSKKKDGDNIKPNDLIMEIKGLAKDILRLERLILNILQRMSGLATASQQLVKLASKANKNVLVTSTRKTLWGFLDKKAVSLGGGGTHRRRLRTSRERAPDQPATSYGRARLAIAARVAIATRVAVDRRDRHGHDPRAAHRHAAVGRTGPRRGW
jgi:nicotinate-nucleotide pyrophosphorylase (carboxylating)